MKHLVEMTMDGGIDDAGFDSPVFKIRYRANTDLSNKRTEVRPEPINDLLDRFQEGDKVVGRSIVTRKKYKGTISSIVKDVKGNGLEIRIIKNGKNIRLLPSSVEFQDDGDKGNKRNKSVKDYQETMRMAYDNQTVLEHITRFDDFIN